MRRPSSRTVYETCIVLLGLVLSVVIPENTSLFDVVIVAGLVTLGICLVILTTRKFIERQWRARNGR